MSSLFIASLTVVLVLAVLVSLYTYNLRRQWQLSTADLKNQQEKTFLLEKDKVRLESEVFSLQNQLKTQEQHFKEGQSQLKNTFDALAAQALERNTKQFLELARSVLEKDTQLAQADLKKRQEAIDHLLQPIRENLEKYQSHLDGVEKDRQRAFLGIENELRKVVETHGQLSRETSALKNALKRPHVRGRWGEVQLKNCVELSGMSEYADVTLQDSSTLDDGQRVIPDMTVRMPGGRIIVVDAKTPIDAFMEYLEASTDEEKQTQLSRHGRLIKDHVKKLSLRSYADSLKDSADFTVLFLPNESFLYAALESQPDLVEFALQKKILVATPPTLIGLLKVIRFGWNEERLAENAQRISEAGKELHKRMCDFVEAYVNVGKHLEKAKAEYDVGLHRLEHRVLVQARRLEQLGAKSNKELPEGMGEVSEEILAVVAPALEAPVETPSGEG